MAQVIACDLRDLVPRGKLPYIVGNAEVGGGFS